MQPEGMEIVSYNFVVVVVVVFAETLGTLRFKKSSFLNSITFRPYFSSKLLDFD